MNPLFERWLLPRAGQENFTLTSIVCRKQEIRLLLNPSFIGLISMQTVTKQIRAGFLNSHRFVENASPSGKARKLYVYKDTIADTHVFKCIFILKIPIFISTQLDSHRLLYIHTRTHTHTHTHTHIYIYIYIYMYIYCINTCTNALALKHTWINTHPHTHTHTHTYIYIYMQEIYYSYAIKYKVK